VAAVKALQQYGESNGPCGQSLEHDDQSFLPECFQIPQGLCLQKLMRLHVEIITVDEESQSQRLG